MAKQITQFDLLISCPSDVKEELEIIKETVANFNRTVGEANQALLITRHWSTDSYPESGGSPQKLLNKQFVLNCDAAVAVFWTRFGTPTDEYGSGTEEEIEELIKSGKQVFLYFSDCSVNPSTIDYEQYQKVQAFRDKYRNTGIYGTYSNIDDFRKDFLNHLCLHFIKLLTSENSFPNTAISKLTIKGVSNGKVADKTELFKRYYSNSRFIDDFRTSILEMYDEVKEIILPRKITETKEIDKNENTIIPNELSSKIGDLALTLQKQLKDIGSIFPSFKVVINDDFVNTIKKFAQENSVSLSEDEFFYIGELTKHQQFSMGFGQSYTLNGSDDEKKKYELIKQIYWKINEYRQYIEYLSSIDAKYNLELAVNNAGTRYDEDLDIKLYIKKGLICTLDNLPFPGDDILEEINHFLDHMFKSKKSVSVNEYNNYPELPVIPYTPVVGIYGPSHEETVKRQKMEYNNMIENIFCYDFFQDDEYDIICFKLEYIKQNTSVFFPAVLVFDIPPDIIKYEIFSKYLPEPIKGELQILNDSN